MFQEKREAANKASYTLAVEELDCPIFQEKHSLSNDNQLSLSQRELKAKLTEMKKKCDEFKLNLENGEDQIREHCILLRNKVNLETEILIENLHQSNEKLIAEIDKYENDCVGSFNKKKIGQDIDYDKLVAKINRFHVQATERLAMFKFDDEFIQESLASANNLINKLLIKDKTLTTIKFAGNLMEFEKSKDTCVASSTLGSLVSKPLTFNLGKIQDIYFTKTKVDPSYPSSLDVFKLDRGYYSVLYTGGGNYSLFFIDDDLSFNMKTFNSSGTILTEISDMIAGAKVIAFHVVKMDDKYLLHVRYATSSQHVNFRGQKQISRVANIDEKYELIIITDNNLNYLDHICNSLRVVRIAANKSYILSIESYDHGSWIMDGYHCTAYNMQLKKTFLDCPLDELLQSNNNQLMDLRMNETHIFFLCIPNKLRIFDIENLWSGQVKEIEFNVDAIDQMKLLSTETVALFDYKNNEIRLFNQSGGFDELESLKLPVSFDNNMYMSQANLSHISFFNSHLVRYFS
jgi:hypothetical protein